MLAKLKRENRELKAQIRRLQPMASAGVLTSRTTGGVVREVNGAAARLQRSRRVTVARWA